MPPPPLSFSSRASALFLRLGEVVLLIGSTCLFLMDCRLLQPNVLSALSLKLVLLPVWVPFAPFVKLLPTPHMPISVLVCQIMNCLKKFLPCKRKSAQLAISIIYSNIMLIAGGWSASL